MRISFVLMFISLWITSPAFAWGELGHRVVAEYGTAIADPSALVNCRVTAGQLVSHTNDPDKIWKQQRRRYPQEAKAHFFHVDRQPSDWRSRKDTKERDDGFLVYRITSWIDEARSARVKGDWATLSERLYGLSHYVGDLTQPLHLHHDHDGVEAGLPDIHSQFETKMLGRYEHEVRAGVETRLRQEKTPPLWAASDMKTLIFDIAQQSSAKTARLFENARPALQTPKASRKNKKKKAEPRFVKKELWKGTATLAMDQLSLSARLWAHVLNSICK